LHLINTILKDLFSAEKYSSRLEKDFSVFEFLESIADILSLNGLTSSNIEGLYLTFRPKDPRSRSVYSKVHGSAAGEGRW
jgi:hypothetical protein